MNFRKNTHVIILIALLLLGVTSMNTWMVYKQMTKQTYESGIYQLKTISGEFENAISSAEILTMEIAVSAAEYLDDKDALETYMYSRKAELVSEGTGAYNMYIAGTDFAIMPDFDMPDDYIPTERVWYTGAAKNGGRVYVSPPYQDAMTGDICFTVSVMLGDMDAVLGVDYTMETIQTHINQTYETGSHSAVIVTDEGIIAGCSDESLIGDKLTESLPDYTGIWSLAKNTEGVATTRIKAEYLYENLFAAESGNGWYLIISESDWDMYRDSYIQLAVTELLSIMLFAVVVVLYIFAANNRKRAEAALASKEEFLSEISDELKEPLNRILDSSNVSGRDSVLDYDAEMARIHAAGEKLSHMIGQIISYSDIVKNDNAAKREKTATIRIKKGINRRFRTIILTIMILVMLVSLYANISVTYRWGCEMMQSQAETYEFKLAEWIDAQKSILDMFVSTISTNPEMLDDYEGTIDYLNRITVQYPEISATYMSNPKFDPCVYMNNGWKPEPGWRVEERQWYIDTVTSGTGWSISAPYYDEQTGGYCVTISEVVYDAENGAFLGCFGIDFFMDKLVDILGDSYSDHGYAFLVDTGGDIINHPHGSYQMSADAHTNVSSLPYGGIRADGISNRIIKDYDGEHRIVTARRNTDSNFTVYAVSDFWTVYGRMVIYGCICFFAFLICIILVFRLLSDLIRSQQEANERIQHAADAAIAAGQAKSRFLAQMSHEIRTPINAVLGMNEMILRESTDDSILDYADNIQSAGRNLLTLINSILDFSKIEDGKMEIIPVRYDLATMINNLVNSIAERAAKKHLELVVDIDETLPSVLYGDDIRISQVVMNLLTNAVKYTDKGRITLSMRQSGADRGTVDVYVRVSDTGKGIKEEDMEKLFASFERIEENKNRNVEGTGLGMSIVTRLLDMMDSKLHVESEYGKGSDFYFTITQSVVDSTPIGDYRQHRLGRRDVKEDHPYYKDARVLVVDDNEMNLKVVKSLLKLNGIVPDLALSGEDALELMKKRSYNIVFLDHMMPVMDGIETLQKMKEMGLKSDETVVIALTANAVVGAKENYLEAGFDDYLSKPIDVSRLEDKLTDYLPEEMLAVTNPLAEAEASHKEDSIMEFEPEDTDSQKDDETSFNNAGLNDIMEKIKQSPLDEGACTEFCAGDEELYIEIIGDYIAEYEKKRTDLDVFAHTADLKEYRILIHSLKSASKTIGASDLSDEARLLEEAADAGDIAYIDAHHPDFIKEYEAMVTMLTGVLGEKEN